MYLFELFVALSIGLIRGRVRRSWGGGCPGGGGGYQRDW